MELGALAQPTDLRFLPLLTRPAALNGFIPRKLLNKPGALIPS